MQKVKREDTMVVFKEIPPGLKTLFKPYRHIFNNAQYKHFQFFVTGLIVNKNKTIQEINDALSNKDQSSMNRFITKQKWDTESLNSTRLRTLKVIFQKEKKGIAIVDDTLLHKTGMKMEKANYHRSGVTKHIEWGHSLVNCVWTSKDKNSPIIPIKDDVYLREEDADTKNKFRTKREIALGQIEYAINHNLNFNVVVVDAGFQDSELYKELRSRNKDVIMGVRVTTKISIERQKRITINDYLGTLTDNDFELLTRGEKSYFLHTRIVSVRGIGKVRLLISYKLGDEEEIKIYITNLLDATKDELIDLLIRRWDVETWHRDGKQHLGLEAYQVRKYRGMQVVVLAVLVAYTLLILSRRKGIFKRIELTFKRGLRTIGELCRFMHYAALKGWRWILRLFQNPNKFRNFLNRHVLVKNAKV